jgi:hypothetical protein
MAAFTGVRRPLRDPPAHLGRQGETGRERDVAQAVAAGEEWL